MARVDCRWNVAGVTRPLHWVSQIAGPYEGDGNHDVLFNNKRCVVVETGIVEAILKHLKPVAEYGRDGNSYFKIVSLNSLFKMQILLANEDIVKLMMGQKFLGI